MIKICKHCGCEFIVPQYRKDTAKFCCKTCMDRYRSIHDKGENSPRYKGKIRKICEYCGKEFEVNQTNKKRKFCSKKCYTNYQSEILPHGKDHPLYKKVSLICLYCNNEFEVHYHRKDTAKFCCRDCYYNYYRENPDEKDYKHDRIILKCEYCNNEFEVILSKSDRRFCSPECRNNYFIGKNSPTYKGKDHKICEQCGREFEVYKYRSEDARFCCYECYWDSMETSSVGYCRKFNENFKVVIRRYFGCCFMTGKKYDDNGNELSIHHVNYMKSCGCSSPSLCIYIPVTSVWNIKFNGSKEHNRWYWYSYLMIQIFLRHPNYFVFHIPVWGMSELEYNYSYVFEKFRRR